MGALSWKRGVVSWQRWGVVRGMAYTHAHACTCMYIPPRPPPPTHPLPPGLPPLQTMDVVQTLDGGRRNMYDPDEIEEEQRERERRNRVNAEFQQFVKRVQVRGVWGA